MLPRLGAFEISTVIDDAAILFFSKLQSQIWPLAPAVAERVMNCVVEWEEGSSGAELRSKYFTKGPKKPEPVAK